MSTVKINIRDVDDPFERYKMPMVEVRHKYQGKYNITYIVNLKDIVKALKTDIDYVVKYLTSKLNVKSTLLDSKELELKGIFSAEEILIAIRKFISEYILCKNCTLPEIDYYAGKSLSVKCRSCGSKIKCDTGSDKIYKCIYQKELKLKEEALSVKSKIVDERDEMEKQLSELDISSYDIHTEWTSDAESANIRKEMQKSEFMSKLFQ